VPKDGSWPTLTAERPTINGGNAIHICRRHLGRPSTYSLVYCGIEAQHLDRFINNLFDLDEAAFVAAAERQRRSSRIVRMMRTTTLMRFCARVSSRRPRRSQPIA